MAFFGFLGSMFLGIIIIGVVVVLGIIMFLMAGARRLRGATRSQRTYSRPTAGYSTASNSQRYTSSQANGASSRYSSRTYSGPTAKRAASQNARTASPAGEVVEVPLLEVQDVPDTYK